MAGALTASQLQQFAEDGYLILRGMGPPALCDTMRAVASEQLRDAVPPLEYESEVGYEGAPESLEAPGGRTARRLRDDFDLDAAGLAVAVNLLGRIRELELELQALSARHP